MDHHQKVKAYYEHNTSKFLKWGQHGKVKSMHQALWAEGVSDLAAAIHYVHHLIEDQIHSVEHLDGKILDLGCGVGSSLLYLAERNKEDFHGITLSPTQVGIAREQRAAFQLKGTASFYEGDMLELPELLDRLKLSYAIEAFVHQNDADTFFRQLAERSVEGAILCICDDVLTDKDKGEEKREKKITAFEEGWLLGSLLSVKEIEKTASTYGWTLMLNQNLTPYMRINRPRDRWLDFALPLMPLLGYKAPYIYSLKGGRAKQACLQHGWVAYRWMVFQKT